MGAGLPAKQAPRCMAPASPVFAGTPAPTVFICNFVFHISLPDPFTPFTTPPPAPALTHPAKVR
ncbi:hypothetical protein DZA28_03750 [Pseudomonas alloputida]|uniref:Uncharacterized protein n=3 Tax=Pseudomonas TaxID=286 RepID=A0A2N1ISR7_9PSED|nr:hypothetical protein [Pseudomonas hunanensis]PKI23758.1 hypothetical protein CXB65_11935 [Pseudomonas monteilii]TRZ59110.1 hypothetical protein DZA28_03750 [Pseudomonas alloputida]